MDGMFITNRKKILIVCFLLVIISMIIFNSGMFLKYSIHTNLTKLLDTQTYFEPSIPQEGSIEEIYQDIFVTLLLPCIDEAVENYYGQPFSVDPYAVRILRAERPNGYRTFLFEITMEVMPYYGPHNSVGVDHITIKVGSHKAIVEKFEHIRSYKIPPKPTRP